MIKESSTEVIEMNVIDFEMFIAGKNVNEVGAILTLINQTLNELVAISTMYKQEMFAKIVDSVKSGSTVLNTEFEEFSNQLVSIGGCIRNLDEKMETAKLYLEYLTPDCFKNTTIVSVEGLSEYETNEINYPSETNKINDHTFTLTKS